MLGSTASIVILTVILSNTKSVSSFQNSLALQHRHLDLLRRRQTSHDGPLSSPVGRHLPSEIQPLHGGFSSPPQGLRLPQSQEETKRNDRKLFNKTSKKNLVTKNGIKDSLYVSETPENGTVGYVNLASNNPGNSKVFENSWKPVNFEEIGVPGEQFYLQELEKKPQSDILRPPKDIFLDRSDLRSWKYMVLKKAGDDLSMKADLNGFMQALSNARGVTGAGHEVAHLPSSNALDVPLHADLKSKMSVHSSKEVSSAEVRDLALKRWLKSSSAAFSSNEAERRKIEELSYKILSQTDPEEESKDEANDSEIYKAVFTSVAAYQIRKLQRKLRNGRVKRDEEMVCYKDLGCFRDDGAFDYLDLLPSPPEEINTKFLLFTRKNPEAAQVFDPSNATSIQESHYDPASLTKVIIHGFGSSCHRVWVREMRVALLTMVDVNLICVDWENGATVPNYMRAASNTRLVGRQVGRMVESLVKTTNTSLDQFHLIGFSLGAHVSGHAGKKLKLKRISGLDPAGPLFENFPPSVRLDASDAEFVDVIHTNADSLIWGGLGAYQAMGHVDFYPNGGRMQKGCTNLFVGGVSDILWPTEGDGRSLCNHRRGYKYFVESIAPVCKFPSFVCTDYDAFLRGDCFPCEGCGNMGYYSDKAEGRGQLYLVTRDSEPFCANQYKVSLKHSGGPPLLSAVSTYGRVDVTFIGADGINETIPLTRMPDEELKAGSTTVRILVPHPAITGIRSVQLLYTAYDGWLSSGSKRWAIDKVSIMDSFGNLQSFCKLGVTLESGVPLVVRLQPAECTPRFTPWRPTLPDRPDGSVSDLSSTVRPNTTSSITIVETDVREPGFNSSVNKSPDENVGVIEKPTKIPPSSPDANDLPSGDLPTSFDGASTFGGAQSSVIISFPGSSRVPPLEVQSRPSSSSASSSFSISLPSAPSQQPGASGTAYKFVLPGDVQDSSHTNLHWSYNYDDFFDVNQQGMRFNSTASRPNFVPTLVVTSQPIPDYLGSSSSETLVHVTHNGTRHNVSNLRDGPAPNLYPASMTEGMDESDYSLNITETDFDVTTTLEELLPGVALRPKNFSSSQSRVVIKVNESPAKLWGLTGFQTVSERKNISNSSNSTSASFAGTNSRPDKTPLINRKNETSSEMKKISGAHTKTPSIDPESSLDKFEGHRPDVSKSKPSPDYSPQEFSYVLQNPDSKGQSLLVLNEHDNNRRPGDNPLTAYVNNPFGFDDSNNPGLGTLGAISYNSLVDGEVPMNERARALFSNSNKEHDQASTPADEARNEPKITVTDVISLTRNVSSQHPPAPLTLGISSSDGRIQNFNPYGAEHQYNLEFQRQPNDRNEPLVLPLNLRPPAALVLPQLVRDQQRGDELILSERHPNFVTTSAPSYLRQLSAFIPQLFSNPLSSLSKDDSENASSGHRSLSESQNNGTYLASPPLLNDDSRIRVKGVKLASGDSDLKTTEKPSTITPTERSFPYSWSYFFGSRSSGEIYDGAETEDNSSGTATGNTGKRSEPFDYRPLPSIPRTGEGEQGAYTNGEWSSSYATHELLHHTPAVQQKHVNQPHHFSHTAHETPVKAGDTSGHISRYGSTTSPGHADGFGVGSPQSGKPLPLRRTEGPSNRRRPRHQHRFHPRGGKAGSGPLRHFPKAIKLPKNLPPNYPFYQLNPLTALPTHLVAPPPLNAMPEPRHGSKNPKIFADKNSAHEVAEPSDLVVRAPSADTGEPPFIIANSSISQVLGNFSGHAVPIALSENIDLHQEASTRAEIVVEQVKNLTNNSTERRMQRKLNIDENRSIEVPSLKPSVKGDDVKQTSSNKLQSTSQPELNIASYNYNHNSDASASVRDSNRQKQSKAPPHLTDVAAKGQPFLEKESIRYAMSHVPSSQAPSSGVPPKQERNSELRQWPDHHDLTASVSGTRKAARDNLQLAVGPAKAVSFNYDAVPEDKKDIRKKESSFPLISSHEDMPQDLILNDASSASNEFSFIDSSFASLLPSPALPDPLNSKVNPDVIDEQERFFSEKYIPAPSLTYKSFLSSPSEMSSAEYRERFATSKNPSNSPASEREQFSMDGGTAGQFEERSSDSNDFLENSGLRDERSFGGRSLSVEYDLDEVLRKMSLSPGGFKPSFHPKSTGIQNHNSSHYSGNIPPSLMAANSRVYTEHPPVSQSSQHLGSHSLRDVPNSFTSSSFTPSYRRGTSDHGINSNFGPYVPTMDDRRSRAAYDDVFASQVYNRPRPGSPATQRLPSFRWGRNVGPRVRGRGGISIPLGHSIVGPRRA